MRIEQLAFVCEVAKTKSMSAAAANFYVTPQYISKAIKLLEDELEIIIFRREKTGVFLTIEGQKLYDKAEKVLREWNALEDSFAHDWKEKAKDPEGTYIGYLSNDSARLLEGIQIEILKKYPNVVQKSFLRDSISITNDVNMGLIEPDYFMVTMEKGALLLGDSFKEKYDMYTLREDTMCILAGKDSPLATAENLKKGATFRHLANVPMAVYMDDRHNYDQATQILARREFFPNIRFFCDGTYSVLRAVKSGGCITVCTTSFAKAVLDEDLTIIPLNEKMTLVYRFLIRKERAEDAYFSVVLEKLAKKYPDFRKIS